jgi:cell division protein FtsW
MTLALALSLLLLGLTMVASTSMALSSAPFAFLSRQLLAAAAGVGCAALLLAVPTSWLQRASVPLAVLGIGLLTGALYGHPVNGSRRWLQLASWSFQPSEVARPLILLFLAAHAARHQDRQRLAGR